MDAGLQAFRDEREHPDKERGSRSEPQRDRDRVLYASAFRRLADVTQVVPASEGPVFHNRLTHSLEVAQFGRRLAEKLVKDDPQAAAEMGGIDPDVVETACLAHDIGHPPFGHVAEQELKVLVLKAGLRSSFEGNAQSFRIVTKLAPHPPSPRGLNLTRATLNAILKYPWPRETPDTPPLKWGAYDSEFRQLRFARQASIPAEDVSIESEGLRRIVDERELVPEELRWAKDHSFLRNLRRCPEAQIMDWADDVTYAVHDAMDFYCAGLLPLDRLTSGKDDSERQRFFEEVFGRHDQAHLPLPHPSRVLEEAFTGIIGYFPNLGPYKGSTRQRANLINYSSTLINRYAEGAVLNRRAPNGPKFEIGPEFEKEVFMLKQMTWSYVILDPRLATQQHGQRKVIRDMFEFYLSTATEGKDLTVFPVAVREYLERNPSRESRVRAVSDFIASMSGKQALLVYRKLMGTLPGSVLDGGID